MSRNKASNSKGSCAYCGGEACTDDHVISKALYPRSKAASKIQRITVPACTSCNGGWANDEPHFRNVMLLSGDKTPAVQELWEGKTRRSFDQCDGGKRVVDLAVQFVPVTTPEGTRHVIYPAKDERVLRVVRKTVRGLCHHHGLLSPVHDGQVMADIYRFAIPPDFLAEMTLGDTDRDVLEYRFSLTDEAEIHSGWLLTYYSRTAFFCIVFRSLEAHAALKAAATDPVGSVVTA